MYKPDNANSVSCFSRKGGRGEGLLTKAVEKISRAVSFEEANLHL